MKIPNRIYLEAYMAKHWKKESRCSVAEFTRLCEEINSIPLNDSKFQELYLEGNECRYFKHISFTELNKLTEEDVGKIEAFHPVMSSDIIGKIGTYNFDKGVLEITMVIDSMGDVQDFLEYFKGVNDYLKLPNHVFFPENIKMETYFLASDCYDEVSQKMVGKYSQDKDYDHYFKSSGSLIIQSKKNRNILVIKDSKQGCQVSIFSRDFEWFVDALKMF